MNKGTKLPQLLDSLAVLLEIILAQVVDSTAAFENGLIKCYLPESRAPPKGC